MNDAKQKNSMEQAFLDFLRSAQNTKDYLPLHEMADGHSYQIYARNAYVGIWIAQKQGFIISRYEMGDAPCLCVEYHWDVDHVLGTVKPLRRLEKATAQAMAHDSDQDVQNTLSYLDQLEVAHPLVPGFNSWAERKHAAILWEKRLEEKANSGSHHAGEVLFGVNDPLYKELAGRFNLASAQPISYLQRKYRLGYSRAQALYVALSK